MSKLIRLSSRCASSFIQGQAFQPQNLTLNDFLMTQCEQRDSSLMASFESENRTFTFGQMHETATKIAAGLLALDVKPGERVAIWGPNQPEWLIMKWACAKAGIPLVNINPLYTAPELEYALNKVEVKVLVCPRKNGIFDYEKILHDLIPDIASRDAHSIKCKHLKTLEKIIFYSNEEKLPGIINWSTLEIAGQQNDFKTLSEIKVDTHDIGNIQFTSGTTGMPKAAAISHYNMVNNVIASTIHQSSIIDHISPEMVLCNVLPLYHVFSFTGGSLVGAYVGAANIFPSSRFDPELILKAIHDRKCTDLIGTPTMFSDILNSPVRDKYNISSLSYAVVGGAPVTPSLVRQSQKELDMKISVGYGMTENTCGSFLVPHGSPEDVTVNTVGLPFPGVEAKIIDDDENTLERGQIGEVVTNGHIIFQGYVSDEKKTNESFTKDGFWKTGDLGLVTEDGYLQMAGRSKDMIIRGGENIQPTEIENFITSIPQVQDCYVIGVPSRRLGEEVAAYILLKENVTITEDEIREKSRSGLARFKVPKYIKFTTSYPQTVTGKIKKFELRNQALTDFPELKNELE